VLAALSLARELGALTIGFTGDKGGQLAEQVDLCVYAPADYIGQQEDIHLMLDHVIVSAMREWIEAISAREAQPMKALVLAAGEGTRLRPLTLTRPKPMVPINDKPLLHYTLEWLQLYGIHDVAINLSHHPEVIVDYFANGAAHALDVRLHYSYENPILGTAGAVRHLSNYFGSSPFVVVYGDVLTDLDLKGLISFHHEKVARDPATGITLSLYHVPNPTSVGLVGLDEHGRVNRFLEKPKPDEVFTDLANAGVMVVEPGVIQDIPQDTFYDFGLHLLPKLLEKGVPIYGWIVPRQSYLIDIGSLENYDKAQREWPVHQGLKDR
jgi:NDP-sugar pyrophosphorylase family protein